MVSAYLGVIHFLISLLYNSHEIYMTDQLRIDIRMLGMFVFILGLLWALRSRAPIIKDEYPLIRRGVNILGMILIGIAVYFLVDMVILLLK